MGLVQKRSQLHELIEKKPVFISKATEEYQRKRRELSYLCWDCLDESVKDCHTAVMCALALLAYSFLSCGDDQLFLLIPAGVLSFFHLPSSNRLYAEDLLGDV